MTPSEAVNAASREAQRGSQTLARGLSVLALLHDSPDGLSVAELARQLRLPRSIVTRLVTTLEEQHYLERGERRAYRLGPQLLALGAAVHSDVRERARPLLRDLAEQCGAAAVLVVRDGIDAVVIDVAEPPAPRIRLSFRLGSRHHLQLGAEGMAILAGNPPRQGERPEVTVARQSGYAVSTGEIVPGTWGLAVPVAARRGAAMSVALIAPGALTEGDLVERVRGTAARIADSTAELNPTSIAVV